MSTSLLGYGPHTITTDDDHPIRCVNIEGRPVLLTVGLEFLDAYDGGVTFKSRRKGSNDTYVAQSYVKPDGTVSSATIAASTNVQIDASGKDIEAVTQGRTTGSLRVGFDVPTEL